MTKTQNMQTTAAALAIALGSALTMVHGTATAESGAQNEKCFGIALAGKNDCAGGPGTSCAGSSKMDHQADAWKYVPKGTCEETASPTSPTGKGQLAAFKAQ